MDLASGRHTRFVQHGVQSLCNSHTVGPLTDVPVGHNRWVPEVYCLGI